MEGSVWRAMTQRWKIYKATTTLVLFLPMAIPAAGSKL
jgi:hypothetical protein